MRRPVALETSTATDGAARAGVGHDGRGARTARRASCRSAHAGAVKYLSAADYERARRRDRARQHLPPDAAARRRRRRPLRRPRPRSAAGTGSTLTDSGGFQVFSLEPEGRRRRRHVPQRLRRLDAPLHARSRRSPSRSCSAPTSRWCSTCARRCRARPTSCELAVERTARVGRAGPRRPPARRPGAVRHRPGRHRRGAAGRERRSARSTSTSTATASAGCRVGETRAEMLPALAAAIADLPADRPRYLMGVGDPASLVEAVAARRRPVRLRDADPPRPPRHGAHGGRASSR